MLLDADPLVSFAWIMGAALLAPLLSYATGKRLPAVVLLIGFGLVIGPNVLGLASLDGGVGLIKEIGLGMLFLLAGYEIEPETLRGKEGRTGLATWLMCAVLSFLGAMSIVGFHSSSTAIVLAIALTSTAIGTLLPIMKQHDMLDTPVGRSLLIHGAIGEIAPILAMALLLSSRSTWLTTAVLLAFFLVAAVFELDVVLGAFAAGFILRQMVPEKYRTPLEQRLDIVGYSLFIPVFFVCSGMAINPQAVAEKPWLLVALVPLFYVTRGLPIFLREMFFSTGSEVSGWKESLQLSLYAATALPIIVAVTEVATHSKLLSADNASILVAAGSVTVLLFPLIGNLLTQGRRNAARG